MANSKNETRETATKQERKNTELSPGRKGSAVTWMWLMGTVAVSLILLLLVFSFVLRYRVAEDVRVALSQESQELRQFAAEVHDPHTGKPFASATDLISAYLARQVPTRTQLLAGTENLPAGEHQLGESLQLLGEKRGAAAPTWADLEPSLRQRLAVPGSGGQAVSASFGKLTWVNVEIQAATDSGSVAIIHFHVADEESIRTQILSLAGVCLVVLVLTGVVAWVVTTRITGHIGEFTRKANRAITRATHHGHTVPQLEETGSAEYVRLAQTTNELLAPAEAAVEREAAFSEDLLHELTTPVALLASGINNPESGITREEMHSEIVRLRASLRGVANWQNFSNGKALTFTNDVSVARIVTEAVTTWNRKQRQLTATPVLAYETQETPTDLTMRGDGQALQSALYELLQNAAHASQITPPDATGPSHSPAQENPALESTAPDRPNSDTQNSDTPNRASADAAVYIFVHTTVENTAAGTSVVITVTDAGRGIPEGEHAMVMRRFGRATNDSQPGSGMGLPICAAIAAAHGGTLTLSPAESGPTGSGPAGTGPTKSRPITSTQAGTGTIAKLCLPVAE
ncbi:Signal transduction histidine kinase [Actinobaculum suis]|uniref:histidine kinase n=1 Tax=Actinobaculum suis TaxID=1657 RepID=A0A1G7BLF1_9ACTO|nr:ATP-binding protein [Actinobaculum suis]MDY5153760.1 ATP-binding protein [Actinobaculum suis]SDE27752.1 Signal transduction histidine kinase [Actinobaculum suis]